jgi:DNA-binding CsgD family transcriptional regulator/tetratricopeptide (TPR) repeat protein
MLPRAGVSTAAVTVGRAAELDTVHRALRAARSGESACLLLSGEGGIGKSRLLGEAVAAARPLGLAVAAGRAPITEPAPFSLVAEAVRGLLRDREPVRLGHPFDAGLRLILPEWGPASTQLDGGQLRLLAFEGITRLLRRVSDEQGGLLLALDDLHAADPDSLEALRYAVSASVGGLVVIAAYRPGESAVADELARVLTGTPWGAASGAAMRLELTALPLVAVGDLIRSLLGAVPAHELVSDVLSRTDGVPLLVEEVVAAHLRAGSVLFDGAAARWRWPEGAGAPVPRSVRGMVESRLALLPGPIREVLTASAVAGLSAADPAGLLAAVAGVDDATVAEALRRGVDAGLLRTQAGAIGFRHQIIGEAVLEAAVPQVVLAMHRRSAAALGDGFAARRAAHLAAAGELDEAARLYADAAVSELGTAALLGAERLATRAVEIATAGVPGRMPAAGVGVPAGAVRAETRAAAADALAAVLTAQGRWAEALTIDAATVASSGDTAERRHRMAAAALDAGDPVRARDILSRAADTTPLARVLAARVALVGGDAALALAEANAVLAVRVADEPAELPAAADDARAKAEGAGVSATSAATRLAALDIRARALDFLGDRTAAGLAWTEQAAEADRIGDPRTRLRALFQLGKQEFFIGKRPDTLRVARDLAAGTGALVELAWVEETLAIALTLQGDPAAALDLLATAVPRARQLRLDQLGFLLVAQAGAIALTGPSGQVLPGREQQGRAGTATPLAAEVPAESPEALLAEAEALAPAPDLFMFTAAIRADIDMRAGRYTEAVHRMAKARELADGMPGAAPMDTGGLLGWALAAAGERDAAREAFRQARATPDLSRWYPRPVIVEAGLALLHGDIAGVDAAIAAAPGPMPYAVAIMRTAGAHVLGADSLTGGVAATRAPGGRAMRPADAAGARVRWLREALDIYQAGGAAACLPPVRKWLREAGGPVPRQRTAAGVPAELARHGVTAREAEVLRLLRDGMSNADIAAALFVSVRTVETHVSALLGKLQATSRGQLTARGAAISFDA